MNPVRVDLAAVEPRFDIGFDGYFARELEQLRALAADGLVELGGDRIELTPVGRLLMRNVAMTFDAYLAAPAGRAAMSRVI